MNMSMYWGTEEQAWIMPALWELNDDVGVAADWPQLKDEIRVKLTGYGVGDQHATALVQPLEEAVTGGEDFRTLIGQLNSEYAVAAWAQPEEPVATSEAVPSDGTTGEATEKTADEVFDAAFEEVLPPVDELAQAIITDIGAELAELIAAEPEIAGAVTEQELAEWVAEDAEATIDQFAEHGWTA